MLALLLPFLLVPVGTGPLVIMKRISSSDSVAEDEIEASGLVKETFKINPSNPDSEESQASQFHSDLEELTLIQSLKRLDFWLLFVIFFAVIGSGITIVNNFGELVFSITSVNHSEVVRNLNAQYDSILFLTVPLSTSKKMCLTMMPSIRSYRCFHPSILLVVCFVASYQIRSQHVMADLLECRFSWLYLS